MLSYKLMLHDLEDSKPFRKLSDEKKKKNEYVLVNQRKSQADPSPQDSRPGPAEPLRSGRKKVFDLIGLYKYDGWSLSGGLSFSRVERSDFINIYFRSENPELSAFVVNTIGEQFIRFFNSIYGVRSQESTAKLDSLVAEKKRVG
jgi:hypothetical protein